jgi:RNA polymerase sigma-70 factor (ECF subfamily)
VVRYCRGRLARSGWTQASADDLAQEVCLAVLTALPTYTRRGTPFLAYVYRIAAHKVIDAHRQATRDPSHPVAEPPDHVTATSAGGEQWVLSAESRRETERLLAVLSDHEREIVLLRVVDGLSARETAEAVGSTVGAVRVAQHRALGRLRARLAGTGTRTEPQGDAGRHAR